MYNNENTATTFICTQRLDQLTTNQNILHITITNLIKRTVIFRRTIIIFGKGLRTYRIVPHTHNTKTKNWKRKSESNTIVWTKLKQLITKLIIHQIFSLARDWSKHVTWSNIPQPKLGEIRGYPPIFKTACIAKKIWRIIKTIASIWGENMFGYLSLDIICSS